ncbi:hypothetical protein AB0K89_22935 [Streptomyces cinnamoneus]|uniref:hypothetical protein n=1 Tax=Streptomyces cinnamoneus TaxID=53446 RepID=UPI00342EE221
MGSEAADHQDRDAVLGDPAGQLLAEGVLSRSDVQRMLLTFGTVQAEPLRHLLHERADVRPGRRYVDLADGVDQFGEVPFAAGLGQLGGQPPVQGCRVRQGGLGDQRYMV